MLPKKRTLSAQKSNMKVLRFRFYDKRTSNMTYITSLERVQSWAIQRESKVAVITFKIFASDLKMCYNQFIRMSFPSFQVISAGSFLLTAWSFVLSQRQYIYCYLNF